MIDSICEPIQNALNAFSSKNMLMILAGLVVLLIIVRTCQNRNSSVENFKTHKGVKKVFRMFHVKWCGHCKDAKPKFIEFMKKNPNVNAELIDAEDKKNKAVVEAYDIEGYPTFVLTKEGKDKIYEGDRTVEGFEQFISENY